MTAAFRPREMADGHGATLVQFALVLPLLLIFVLAIMDVVRIFTAQALLNKGAADGVHAAVMMSNLDLDYRGLNPTTSVDYSRFQEARRRVLSAAMSIPVSTLLSDPDTPSSMQLQKFSMTDVGLTQDVDPVVSGAGLIRPGERIKDVDDDTWIDHGTYPPRTDGSAPNQSPEMLMQNFPVEVRLEAKIKIFSTPLLPFLPQTLTIHSRAIGYRELYVPKGPLPPTGGGAPEAETTSATTTTVSTTSTEETTSTAPVCVGACSGAVLKTKVSIRPYCPALPAPVPCTDLPR